MRPIRIRYTFNRYTGGEGWNDYLTSQEDPETALRMFGKYGAHFMMANIVDMRLFYCNPERDQPEETLVEGCEAMIKAFIESKRNHLTVKKEEK